ncbi:MAG: histidine phosphatase family protein [Chloroflexota bacterium]
MQFYFIRHGQSENNLLWAQTGSSEGRNDDPGLTEVGWQQARAVARFLKGDGPAGTPSTAGWDPQNATGFGISYLYCSLMLRAVLTGDVIARELGLPLLAWPDVHESGGIYLRDEVSGERLGQPGKTRAFFETHFPNLVLPKDLGDEGWWNRPFEAQEARPARASRALEELLARHGDSQDRVAVVSHGGFYNWLLRAILNLPPESDRWFTLNNAALSRIDFTDGGIELVYGNRADYLLPHLIT